MEGGQVLQACPKGTPPIFTEEIAGDIEGLEVGDEGRRRSLQRALLSPFLSLSVHIYITPSSNALILRADFVRFIKQLKKIKSR